MGKLRANFWGERIQLCGDRESCPEGRVGLSAPRGSVDGV